MPASCPHCGTQFLGPAPPTCPRCQKATAAAPALGASSGGFSLDLKETLACPHCSYECYEENLKDGNCPRCQRPFEEEEEEGGEEESGEQEAGGKPREKRGPRAKGKGPRGKKGLRGKPGKGKPGKEEDAGPEQEEEKPAEKRQVLLTESFKQSVFAAFRNGDPRQAQQLCFELAHHNEEHAKQIYGHLLGVATTKNWVAAPGTRIPAPPPPPAQPGPSGPPAGPAASALAPAPAAAPGPGPGEPLAMPEGLLLSPSAPPSPGTISRPGS